MSEVTNNAPEMEMKAVVVYPAEDIENVLKILDTQMPVRGVETMRGIVNVFDILKSNGSVQQAAIANTDGMSEFVDPSMVTPSEEPVFSGEGEVMYDADETETPSVEEVESVDVVEAAVEVDPSEVE